MTRILSVQLIAYLLCAVLCQSFVELRAADPEKKGSESKEIVDGDPRTLVKSLGADDYTIREKATEQLAALGFGAFGALEEGAKDTDREIRYRSQRLLVSIRQQDFEHKLEAFINDPDETKDHQLPGWGRFRKRMGSDKNVKHLFVQMQRSEPSLMKAMQTSGLQSAVDLLNGRVMAIQSEMRGGNQEISVGSMSAYLFIASEEGATANFQTSQMLCQFCRNSGNGFRHALTAGAQQDLLRKLLGSWIRRGDDNFAYQLVMLAMELDIKDGLILAEKVLKNKTSQPSFRVYSLLAIAKMGDRTHQAVLTPFLSDTAPFTKFTINDPADKNKKIEVSILIQDIALASLLHLHGKDLKKFGFERVSPSPIYLYNPSTLGFDSQEKREASLKKWNDLTVEQKNAKS